MLSVKFRPWIMYSHFFFKNFFSNGKCDPCQPGFGSVLLKALLDNMSFLPAAATGGMWNQFNHK